MNKKGQGLPMNTVVIAIIVIVVLILVVTFFFGGFSNLSERIKEVLGTGTSGMSETLALQSCERYCDNLKIKTFDDESELRVAADRNFCFPREVDLNGDGVVGIGEEAVTCPLLNIPCKVNIEVTEVSVVCGA